MLPSLSFAGRRFRVGNLLLAVALAARLALAVAHAGTVADLDAVNGLPEAKLGAPVSAFKGLIQTEDTGRWLTYKPPGEKLSYAGFEVQGIKYNFFKGKLYSINVEVEGHRSTKGILKVLEQDFGTTHSLEKHHLADTDTDMEVREWTGARVYLLYKSAADSRGAEMIVLDKPTWDLLQVPRQQRAAQIRAKLGGSYLEGDFDTVAPEKAVPPEKEEPAPAPAQQ